MLLADYFSASGERETKGCTLSGFIFVIVPFPGKKQKIENSKMDQAYGYSVNGVKQGICLKLACAILLSDFDSDFEIFRLLSSQYNG